MPTRSCIFLTSGRSRLVGGKKSQSSACTIRWARGRARFLTSTATISTRVNGSSSACGTKIGLLLSLGWCYNALRLSVYGLLYAHTNTIHDHTTPVHRGGWHPAAGGWAEPAAVR